MSKVYIFGAHSRGRTMRVYMEKLYNNIRVEAFLVDDLRDNHLQEMVCRVCDLSGDLNVENTV